VSCIRIAAALCISLLAAVHVRADEDDANRFEIAALVGYRGGGDFDALTGTDNPNIEPEVSYGVSVGWYSDPATKYELLYDVQSTQIEDSDVDLDVEHLHLGGSLPFPATENLEGYISGGLGATRFNPSTGADETRFSVSLALGVDVPIGEHVGFRLEARGYLAFMNGNSEIFCSSGAVGGACLVRAAGDHLFQYAVIGGLGVRF
jgi:hypothetical protein